MSTEPEFDPDVFRDSMRNDDMPPRLWSRGLVPSMPVRPLRSDDDIEREMSAQRRRAERLVDVLHALERDESPPTIPEADEGMLDMLILSLEARIARAADVRGHRFARRGPGLPMACPGCARPVDRAAELCVTAAGGTR